MSRTSNFDECESDRIDRLKCMSEMMSVVVGFSVDTDRFLAAHPNVGAEDLEKLSRSNDEKTRELVTGNPNTPINVLLSLVDDFPRAFLLNPAFNIIALEGLGVFERMYFQTLANILAQKECPQTLLEWAYRYHKKNRYHRSKIFLGIVRNPITPVKIVHSILKMNHESEIACGECFL